VKPSGAPAAGGRAQAPSPAPSGAQAVLTVDLDALALNYRRLSQQAAPAECGAVVKADAYGLGLSRVAPRLWREGCRSFFVATLGEAEQLRALLPDAVIYAFNGLLPGTAPRFAEFRLRPVLNSAEEIGEWAGFCQSAGGRLPAAIHLDSGMNRLGLSPAELDAVTGRKDLFAAFALTLVMSHLACADQPEHPNNEAQRRLFEARRKHLPEAPASLANSGGILLGRAYHLDLVRPGIALYGGEPWRDATPRFAPVVRLEGRILQIREAQAGDTVGYGATRHLRSPARIATVAAGYADGLPWALSAGDGVAGLNAYLGPHPAPILGRVSMDLITLDVTGIPETHAARGRFATLIGAECPPEAAAAHAGSVNYEILTNLCRRAFRRYVGG
jgi:alanine racemase